MECPESIEGLQELEKALPLCRVTLYNQAKARIKKGSAKSISDAAKQLADETGKSVNTIRSAINRASGTDAVHQSGEQEITPLSQLSGTAKHASKKQPVVALGEEEIIREAKKINSEKARIRTEENLIECKKKFNKKETCAEEDLGKLINENKKFSTIYADPPWQYSNQATRASTGNHYNTMSIEQISKLPIQKLTEDNAHLHLWTTNAFLFDAKKIIESWGFEYKSCFVWVKPQMGIGNYWRVSHEFMLFGIKGKQPFLNRSQKSWEAISRTKHSKKPEEIAHKIELVSPGPYLELFGRQTRENWTVWGNEIERHMFNKGAFDD